MGDDPADDASTSSSWADVANGLRRLIPLGIALVVGVLVTLGLEGETRTRFIRNEPDSFPLGLCFVLGGLALPVVAKGVMSAINFGQRRTGRAQKAEPGWLRVGSAGLSGLGVLGGTVLIIFAGTSSIGEREHPNLAVSASQVAAAPELLDVTVTATGLSLASRDRMLLRVVALRDTATSLLTPLCSGTGRPGQELAGLKPEEVAQLNSESEQVRILYWGESAASATGTSSATARVRISNKEFRYICAYAALNKKPVADADSSRRSLVVFDARNVPAGGLATATAPTGAESTKSAEGD